MNSFKIDDIFALIGASKSKLRLAVTERSILRPQDAGWRPRGRPLGSLFGWEHKCVCCGGIAAESPLSADAIVWLADWPEGPLGLAERLEIPVRRLMEVLRSYGTLSDQTKIRDLIPMLKELRPQTLFENE
jgi:hypothetical protein